MASKKVGWDDSKAGDEIDWDKQSTEGPPPLPKSVYEFRVTKAEPMPTREGEPMVELQLKIDREFAQSEGQFGKKGRAMRVKIPFSAPHMIKQLAEATGTTPPKRPTYGLVEEWCAALVESGGGWLRSKLRKYENNDGATVTTHDLDRFLKADDAGAAFEALKNGTPSAEEAAAEDASGDAPVRKAGRRR